MARIDDLLAKGLALTAANVHEIEREIVLMPLAEAHEKEPWIWEGVALIVNDPDYAGDAKLPEIE